MVKPVQMLSSLLLGHKKYDQNKCAAKASSGSNKFLSAQKEAISNCIT